MQEIRTDLSNLNEKQKEAVTREDKRLLVLAGAGSGKTKTLLQKLIYLIEEKNVNPFNILADYFTQIDPPVSLQTDPPPYRWLGSIPGVFRKGLRLLETRGQLIFCLVCRKCLLYLRHII
jgi:UvrD-like helicase family protein